MGIFSFGDSKCITYSIHEIEDLLEKAGAVPIAILDGVLYIKGNNKMYRQITTEYKDKNIMSALVLREFLYQL